MSFTPSQDRRRVERKTSDYRYYSGTDVIVVLGGKDLSDWVQEVIATEFAISESVQPLYEYDKYTYSAKAGGQRIIKGQFVVNFVDPIYITSKMQGGFVQVGSEKIKNQPSSKDSSTVQGDSMAKTTKGQDTSGKNSTLPSNPEEILPDQLPSDANPVPEDLRFGFSDLTNETEESTVDDVGIYQGTSEAEEGRRTQSQLGQTEEEIDVGNQDRRASVSRSLWNTIGRVEGNESRMTFMHILFYNGDVVKSITLEDINILQSGMSIELTNGTVERYQFMARDITYNENEDPQVWDLAVEDINETIGQDEHLADQEAADLIRNNYPQVQYDGEANWEPDTIGTFDPSQYEF